MKTRRLGSDDVAFYRLKSATGDENEHHRGEDTIDGTLSRPRPPPLSIWSFLKCRHVSGGLVSDENGVYAGSATTDHLVVAVVDGVIELSLFVSRRHHRNSSF